jgi:hypothetical protein
MTQEPFTSAVPCAEAWPSNEMVMAAPAADHPQRRGESGSRWSTMLEAMALGMVRACTPPKPATPRSMPAAMAVDDGMVTTTTRKMNK